MAYRPPLPWQISGCTWIAFYLAEWNQQAREGVLRNIATKQHFGSLMMLITTCRGYQLFLSDPESEVQVLLKAASCIGGFEQFL